MYISKKDREVIKQKFDGRCAYSGTILESDWQIDHVKPLVRNWWENTAVFEDNHKLDNMFPVQKLINHYKGSLDLETFRNWRLGGLKMQCYRQKCKDCGHQWDFISVYYFRELSKKIPCPECKSDNTYSIIIMPTNIVFKGPGWNNKTGKGEK